MFNKRQILLVGILGTALLSANVIAQNAVIVNGKSIPKAQLDKLVQRSGQPDNPQVRDQAREMLVTRELVLQEADKRGVLQKEMVREQLEQARMGVLVGAVFEDYVEKEGVAEADLKAAYESVKAQYTGKEYHVEHILVEKESDAKAIIAQLKSGASFEEIAKAKSMDPGSAKNGGDLNYILEDNLGKEFFDIISPMKKGQISAPIKTTYGWNIFKVENFRNAEAGSFESIKASLEEQMKKEEVKKLFVDISESSKVEILIKSEAEQVKPEPSEQKSEEKPAEQE